MPGESQITSMGVAASPCSRKLRRVTTPGRAPRGRRVTRAPATPVGVVRRNSVPNRISDLALTVVIRYETLRGCFQEWKDAFAGYRLFR